MRVSQLECGRSKATCGQMETAQRLCSVTTATQVHSPGLGTSPSRSCAAHQFPEPQLSCTYTGGKCCLFPGHVDKRDTQPAQMKGGFPHKGLGCTVLLSSLEWEAGPSQLVTTPVEIKGFLSEIAVPPPNNTEGWPLAILQGHAWQSLGSRSRCPGQSSS